MSVEHAHAFMAHARKSPELGLRIEALKGAQALDDLAVIAKEAGFEFTVEEYRAAVVDAADGELSDAALDQLARDLGMHS
jgi:predicted ribosomally synthesized peptide with nif11-like leader